VGKSGDGWSENEFFENFFPHQGQSSTGIGDAVVVPR
jgi:hypothetical protein